MNSIKNLIKPGLFGTAVAADSRRLEFDFKNEEILSLGKRPDFLFLGDSVIHMWELNAYFGGSGKFIVNRGIGGDTSEYLLKRLEGDALQLQPDYIILTIGANDISGINGDVWWRVEGRPEAEVEAAYLSNMQIIVKMCRNAECNLAIGSIYPSDAAPPYKNIERKNMAIRLNEGLKQICSENGLIYVDYFSALVQPDGKTIIYEYSPDGIHPNAKGYSAMAKVLKEALLSKGIVI